MPKVGESRGPSWLSRPVGTIMVAMLVVGVALGGWALSLRPEQMPLPLPGSSTSAGSAAPTATPDARTTAASSAASLDAGTSGISGELEPVDLLAPSERPSGVVVVLREVEPVQGEARLPGEVSKPALRFTISIENRSESSIELGAVVVNGYSGPNRDPLEIITSPGGLPFSGTLAPGAEATGVYLFTVSEQARADVTVTVDPRAGEPASVFRGDAQA